MREQPVMADFIEARTNVALQDPFCASWEAEYLMKVPNRVSSGTLRTKPIGIWVAGRFRNWFQCEQVECLHCTVLHCRNSEWAFFAVRLRYIYSPQRLGLVARLPQRV